MNHLLIIPFIATLLFCLGRMLEKYWIGEKTDMKCLIFDSILVFIVTLLAKLIFPYIEFLDVINESKMISTTAEIFTDPPNF